MISMECNCDECEETIYDGDEVYCKKCSEDDSSYVNQLELALIAAGANLDWQALEQPGVSMVQAIEMTNLILKVRAKHNC